MAPPPSFKLQSVASQFHVMVDVVRCLWLDSFSWCINYLVLADRQSKTVNFRVHSWCFYCLMSVQSVFVHSCRWRSGSTRIISIMLFVELDVVAQDCFPLVWSRSKTEYFVQGFYLFIYVLKVMVSWNMKRHWKKWLRKNLEFKKCFVTALLRLTSRKAGKN